MPKVSVIIPTYNRKDYVQAAVDSVLAQTHAEREIIVVNDGSTDGTEQVLTERYGSRIQYLWQENGGRSSARNRGLAKAQGTYVAFLDDDDLYLPNKLAAQVACLEREPGIDLVASGVHFVNAEGQRLETWRPWLETPELDLLSCLYGCPLAPSMVLLRCAVLERMDKWFDPEMEAAEDTDFFLRMLAAGCRFAWLPETLGIYRRHQGRPQRNFAEYRNGNRRLLDKMYARTDLPECVLAERNNIYLQRCLAGALRAYAACDVREGQIGVIEATAWLPDLTAGGVATFAARAADVASALDDGEAKRLLGFMFEHLPEQCSPLGRGRNEAISMHYMGRVFRAKSQGVKPDLKDLLSGVRYSPRWLRNRGVWSIATEAILGQHVAGQLRRATRDLLLKNRVGTA